MRPSTARRGPPASSTVKVDYRTYVDFTTGRHRAASREGRRDQESGQRWAGAGTSSTGPSPGPGRRAAPSATRCACSPCSSTTGTTAPTTSACCASRRDARGGRRLPRPLAYMHDVGGTFGRVGGAKAERKLDVEGWSAVPIWKDRAACTVSIESPRLARRHVRARPPISEVGPRAPGSPLACSAGARSATSSRALASMSTRGEPCRQGRCQLGESVPGQGSRDRGRRSLSRSLTLIEPFSLGSLLLKGVLDA